MRLINITKPFYRKYYYAQHSEYGRELWLSNFMKIATWGFFLKDVWKVRHRLFK